MKIRNVLLLFGILFIARDSLSCSYHNDWVRRQNNSFSRWCNQWLQNRADERMKDGMLDQQNLQLDFQMKIKNYQNALFSIQTESPKKNKNQQYLDSIAKKLYYKHINV